ncbi:uncharacterized protein [Paralichthys olivaceus]|uniref:uncharacterized protein isoform X1 n=1 Tax=Paralichthys olivaceus TaxID=8255 RepID=UPI003753AF7D
MMACRQRSTLEDKRKKKLRDKARDKTRINISEAFRRWKDLRGATGLDTDAEFAHYLLERWVTLVQLCVDWADCEDTRCPLSTLLTAPPLQRVGSGLLPDAPLLWALRYEKTLSSLGHKSAPKRSALDNDIENILDTTEQRAAGADDVFHFLDNDIENIPDTTEHSPAGADDICDEDVYVPLIRNQSFTTSELLLECEEEELEPCQKPTSQLDSKDEDDVRESKNEQLDCKLKPLSPLQRNQVNSTPRLNRETAEPVVFNYKGFTVVLSRHRIFP